MNMIKKIILYSIVVITIFGIGCSNIAKNFGEGFGEAFKESHTIYFVLVWYYKVHNLWPSTREELSEFVNEHKAPIDFTKYDEITISEDNDGNLKCYWRIKRGFSKTSSQFIVDKSRIEKESFPILPLLPRNEGTIEIKKETVNDS